jgi:type I restriction enzyme S subunit
MTPQELKSSILQLAIQGKLVKQLESDCPIDLSKYKNKPTDEYEFDLPNKWVTANLECITDTIPSKQYQVLESQVLKEGSYAVISQSKEYSIGYSNEADKVFHHEKPVVVFGDHTAEVKLVDFDFVVGADGVKIFAPKPDLLPQFLYYVMQFYCIDLSKVGGYSRHYKYLKFKPIPLPPLAEQKRIVAKIEELLPLIDRYEEAWTKLEDFNKRFPLDMQKSILQMAIQGKLVPQDPSEGTGEELYRQIQAEKAKLVKEGIIKKDKPLTEITEDEIPFDIPDSWKWKRLGEITYSWGQKQPDKTFCYVDVGSINNQKHILDENETIVAAKDASSRARKIVKQGDVIFATVRPYLQNICIIDRIFSYEPIVSTAFAVMHCPEGVYNKYLYYYLLSPSFMRFANATDKAKGIAYPAIGEKDFFNGVVPLPPLAEQKRIVAKLEEILPLCECLK